MTRSSSDPAPAGRPGEFALIAELFAPLTRGAPGAFGLVDDAALLAPIPGQELVTTVDALVEGVHFRTDDPPGDIAKKALRVNLSDLAAKGAAPAGYLLALMLPKDRSMDWLRGFAAGLGQDGGLFEVPLLGGDTTATPGPLCLSITAFGWVPQGRMLRRAGARVGDEVFVSGTIGDAGAGLALLDGGAASPDGAALIRRYRVPEPRLALGRELRGLASAGLDVSDGLLADLGHIADVSQVRIVVDADAVPRSPALRALWGDDNEAVLRAVTSGDDYELAFAAAPDRHAEVVAAAGRAGLAVTRIGRVEAGAGVVLQDPSGRAIPVAKAGWTHF